MGTHIPNDFFLEIIELLRFDSQTLCSVALVAQALALSVDPTFSTSAVRDVILRYQKLCDVLEKNPSFAEYTRELRLEVHCNPKPENHYSSFYIDARNNHFSRFLSYFNKLEEFFIGQPEYPRPSLVVLDPLKASAEAIARIFGSQSLRHLTLAGGRPFPTKLLVHAVNITHLHLRSAEVMDAEHSPEVHPPPEITGAVRTPISLSIEKCPPVSYAYLRILLQEEGLFKHHWLQTLVIKGCESPTTDPFCPDKLLQAAAASQGQGKCRDSELGLSH